MSEYWVSKKKYYCKYCDIYIADDAPSRRQHENGLRHQGNRDRFVRGLYKEGERRKKDLAEEKREIARIEAAANASFTRDVHSGLASSTPTASVASASTSTLAKPAKPAASKWSNYSTAQSLGYVDPDDERMKAELERRRTQGLAGTWEVVAPPPPPTETLAAEEDTINAEGGAESNGLESVGQTRKAEEDPDDAHGFRFRKRKMQAGLGEIWDPGDISIKVKKRAAPSLEKTPAEGHVKDEVVEQRSGKMVKPDSPQATGFSVGTHGTVGGWKKATVAVDPSTEVYFDPVQPKEESSDSIKLEEPLPPTMSEVIHTHSAPPFKEEDQNDADLSRVNAEATASSGGMFRKRKTPVGGRASGGARR